MQVECKPLKRQRLRDFAAEHDLVMETVERSRAYYCADNDFENNRWYAHFKNVEIDEGSTLLGATGNGPTPAKAVRNYAARISEKKIVIGAYTPGRKEIYVPVLYV